MESSVTLGRVQTRHISTPSLLNGSDRRCVMTYDVRAGVFREARRDRNRFVFKLFALSLWSVLVLVPDPDPDSDMNWTQLDLNPRTRTALRRAKLSSLQDILCLSGLDLQRLTGLSSSDVQQLITATATACRRHPPVPVVLLQRGQYPWLESGLRLSVGCPVLDELLRGGLPVGGVTELSGESGAGKTQLALQLCLSVQYPSQLGGLESGAVYVCTEDVFPSSRLQQLISAQSCLRADVPPAVIDRLQFSDHVYIEHAADLDSLQVCLSRRVPLLLARGLVRFLVVDSVAALFRCEFEAADWLERTKQLLNFSSMLHQLSQEFNTPVLCINQVTDVFNSCDDTLGPLTSTVSPALGLAWANQVTVRLMMWRLQETVVRGDQCSALRRLEVVFAPHLPRDGRNVAVWREGVRAVTEADGGDAAVWREGVRAVTEADGGDAAVWREGVRGVTEADGRNVAVWREGVRGVTEADGGDAAVWREGVRAVTEADGGDAAVWREGVRGVTEADGRNVAVWREGVRAVTEADGGDAAVWREGV